MEKRRPSYDLAAIKRSMALAETLIATTTALVDASRIGFNRAAIAETIATIDSSMFFKSMTTYVDHRIWQDVYYVPARGLVLYVKFQADALAEFKVMSFKEQ